MGELNIELFKKIRDRIAEIPESYDQKTYYATTSRSPCGTAACLAGEAIICAAPSVPEGVKRLRSLDAQDIVPEEAANLLGLDAPVWGSVSRGIENNATAALFRCGESDDWCRPEVFWPEPFRSQFNGAKSRKARAKAAVAYLDHIIETGSVL